VSVEDTATGAALVFVTTGDAVELRRRVAQMATAHNDNHGMVGVHSQATASDIDGGSKLAFVASGADVGKLQSELRMHAQHLSGGTCTMPAATHTEPPAPTDDPAQKKKAELLAAERAAYDNAKPVFDKWCAKCHAKGGAKASASKLEHFEITTYPFGGHHAMELGKRVRKALAIGGGKPTMPADNKGAVKGDELALIAAWTDAFDASHEGGAHEGHDAHGDHH
jgi:hypothetical protein